MSGMRSPMSKTETDLEVHMTRNDALSMLTEWGFTGKLDFGTAEVWSGECKGDTLEVRICKGMSDDEMKFLLAHEFAHWRTGEMGHNDRLYSFLVPFCEKLGIPYYVLFEMEQGEWWNPEYRYGDPEPKSRRKHRLALGMRR